LPYPDAAFDDVIASVNHPILGHPIVRPGVDY
jgi:hypothetical protein